MAEITDLLLSISFCSGRICGAGSLAWEPAFQPACLLTSKKAGSQPRLAAPLSADQLNRELSVDLLLFTPVVIGVALEASGFGRLLARAMTSPASLDPRQQDIGRFTAGGRARVALRAGEHLVRVVVERSVHHPARRNRCFGNI